MWYVENFKLQEKNNLLECYNLMELSYQLIINNLSRNYREEVFIFLYRIKFRTEKYFL